VKYFPSWYEMLAVLSHPCWPCLLQLSSRLVNRLKCGNRSLPQQRSILNVSMPGNYFAYYFACHSLLWNWVQLQWASTFRLVGSKSKTLSQENVFCNWQLPDVVCCHWQLANSVGILKTQWEEAWVEVSWEQGSYPSPPSPKLPIH